MEEVFSEILAKNKDKIYRVCTLYSDEEEAKDLFQEVLLNIWRSLPSFENKSSVNTWVFRITINVQSIHYTIPHLFEKRKAVAGKYPLLVHSLKSNSCTFIRAGTWQI